MMTRVRASIRGWGTALLGIGLLVTSPTAAIAAGAAAPNGWAAHSAYGLQLSVPDSWKVAYFRSCPVSHVGTLLIGSSPFLSACPLITEDENIVWMQPEEPEERSATSNAPGFFTGPGNGFSGRVENLVVHHIHVTSYIYPKSGKPVGTIWWIVRSKHVEISASGPTSFAVLRTLAGATPRAQAAPGILSGNEYLVALGKTPVTGPISVTRLRPHRASVTGVNALHGGFSRTLPPGDYLLTGHAGDAPCPPVTVTVLSGLTVTAPEIDCQGE